MLKVASQDLILVITQQCNLRCRHCPINKKSEQMNFEIAKKAVSLFLEGEQDKRILRIRFFGGEPILNFPVVAKTMKFADSRRKKVVFDLTTNGDLLTEKIIGKIKKQPNLELILSLAGNRLKNRSLLKKISKLPNVAINLNLWPENLKNAPAILEFLIASGFSRFNFLPAFYIKWSNEQFRDLKNCFNLLARIIKKSKGIQVKNLAINSPLPLFNMALTINCNGDIYAGNFFLDKRLEFLKNEMKLGNVGNLNSLQSAKLPMSFDFNKVLEKFFEKEILQSTNKVNRVLTNFCQKIK